MTLSDSLENAFQAIENSMSVGETKVMIINGSEISVTVLGPQDLAGLSQGRRLLTTHVEILHDSHPIFHDRRRQLQKAQTSKEAVLPSSIFTPADNKVFLRVMKVQVPVELTPGKDRAFTTSIMINLRTSSGEKIVKGLKTAVIIYMDKITSSPPLASKSQKKPPFACRYLDKVSFQWVTDGCTLVGETVTKLICSCTHLTQFSSTPNSDNIDSLPSLSDFTSAISTLIGSNWDKKGRKHGSN